MAEASSNSDEAQQSVSRLIPAEIAEIFGNAPVLSVENHQAYDELLARLVDEWKPRNTTEQMYVRDIADISWEIFRDRRAIANTFALSFKKALQKLFTQELGMMSPSRPKELADAWFKGPRGKKEVESELMKYGLSPEAVVAQVYAMKSELLQNMHRLLALAEARRTAATRNLNEYRAMWPVRETPLVDAQEAALVPNSE